RELQKATAAFGIDTKKVLGEKYCYPAIATGNWGCGAYGGFPPLKLILQWIACSLVRTLDTNTNHNNSAAATSNSAAAATAASAPSASSSSSSSLPCARRLIYYGF